ncbi:MAG: sigma-54 dependent transcriptional regulator [Candidatus Eisenbacteria bacterium]|uniref:DNA-binding transcriptional regulator NtrC n=1 Tax=Eiseniibacteriota bacterium TaxID=2212470 RepID=A0A948W751_UNCEI|nr:sigma-54 dependent transcriptional regulator [Candidatus Eisenbacteria bacterium]MBU1948395.1 sigma-54 dependent transcriptional regulator [Candidatus Eisenbacteria bacterium]MBU2691286.1 sigma-54 dependent transcriptional regulator [Candidatus Eisenbacteria bacterium]
MSRILIIDDDRALCRSLQIQIEAEGHIAEVSYNLSDGLKMIEKSAPELIFLDLSLPDGNGLDLLRELMERDSLLPIVMITGSHEMSTTIEAMRLGAFDYIRKPIGREEFLLMIEKYNRLKNAGLMQAPGGMPFGEMDLQPEEVSREIVGKDPKIIDLLKEIGLSSRGRITILIEGESGTGKELVARALHEATSPGKPFVAINCSSIVSTLPESELFGHERGAFTGAEKRKLGKFEYAQEGTVFLDEIGDMAFELQAKLLRVLQEREFERVGGLEALPFKARVIAATNRDLERMVKEKEFREDLYYRLAVSKIRVPPLRERRGDIPLLLDHFIPRISRRIHKPAQSIDEKALNLLSQYEWPGNIRELENVLTRAIALTAGPVITAEHLSFLFPTMGSRNATMSFPAKIIPLSQMEKEYIHSALEVNKWNINRTAKLLEISPTTLRKKITDNELRRPPR